MDWRSDKYHGRMVDCAEDGTVKSVMTWIDGKLHGQSTHFNSDGTAWWASRYDDGKYLGRIADLTAIKRAPMDLCRPKVCDLDALGH